MKRLCIAIAAALLLTGCAGGQVTGGAAGGAGDFGRTLSFSPRAK